MLDSSLARGGRLAAAGLLCLCTVACGPSGRQPANQIEIVPVTGQILVDGEPTAGVVVIFNNKKGVDPANPEASVSKGITDEEGRVAIGTYSRNDGAPPGEYDLTFTRFDATVIQLGGERPDLFGGYYSLPEESEHSVTVPSGEESVDFGTIELTSP